jgi:hypothetical protein
VTQPPRSRPPTFQPRFTLGLFYLFAFFALYCLLAVSPELYQVMRALPPGPEQERAAQEIARIAIRPRLPFALLGALVTVLAGARSGLLPGLRPRT